MLICWVNKTVKQKKHRPNSSGHMNCLTLKHSNNKLRLTFPVTNVHASLPGDNCDLTVTPLCCSFCSPCCSTWDTQAVITARYMCVQECGVWTWGKLLEQRSSSCILYQWLYLDNLLKKEHHDLKPDRTWRGAANPSCSFPNCLFAEWQMVPIILTSLYLQ